MNRSELRSRATRALVRAAERVSGDTRFWPFPSDVGNERPLASRWGWGRPRHRQFEAMFEASTDNYRSQLAMIERYGRELAAIDRGHRDDLEPCWTNPMFYGLDGASLYWHLRERRPYRYVEIGSGYSTKFAAVARRDGELETEIVSLDPEPRSDVDEICDRVIRERLESVDQEVFRSLHSADIVFLDGSHRLLMGNHLAVFFLEVLPELPAGVIVGVHDIYLPDDYAPAHLDTYWTEQYMLAATLLAGPQRYEVALPCHYVASTSPLQDELDERWTQIGLAGTNAWGSVLWFRVL
jgi:predicted O-methyltransferase YrrM